MSGSARGIAESLSTLNDAETAALASALFEGSAEHLLHAMSAGHRPA